MTATLGPSSVQPISPTSTTGFIVMQHVRTLCTIAVLAAVCGLGGAAAAKEAPPLELIKASTEKVRAIIGRDAAKGTPAHAQNQTELKATVNAFIKFEEIGHLALQKHWDTLPEAQKTEYLHVFRDLIEHLYLDRIGKSLDFQVEYKGQSPGNCMTPKDLGPEAACVRTIAKAGKGKLATDYALKKIDGRWFVYDLILDEISTVETYQDSFSRIIAKEGVDSILRRLKTKLAEYQAKDAKAATAATPTNQAQPGAPK